MQPCFVIVVLALKPDRVGQALALCTFRALFFDFYPYFVWRALGAVQKFSTYSRRLSFNPSLILKVGINTQLIIISMGLLQAVQPLFT